MYHIVFESMGNIRDIVVQAANRHDTKSEILVVRQVMAQEFQCPVDISEKIKGS
ncbi:hypothetical protein ABPS01_09585 [Streptococcus sp. ZJ151]|uniref:hypothetical protein n=1 Tax=Streptococcus jiangjianxini TaxID=3161189 RepID=UPI0032EC31DB